MTEKDFRKSSLNKLFWSIQVDDQKNTGNGSTTRVRQEDGFYYLDARNDAMPDAQKKVMDTFRASSRGKKWLEEANKNGFEELENNDNEISLINLETNEKKSIRVANRPTSHWSVNEVAYVHQHIPKQEWNWDYCRRVCTLADQQVEKDVYADKDNYYMTMFNNACSEKPFLTKNVYHATELAYHTITRSLQADKPRINPVEFTKRYHEQIEKGPIYSMDKWVLLLRSAKGKEEILDSDFYAGDKMRQIYPDEKDDIISDQHLIDAMAFAEHNLPKTEEEEIASNQTRSLLWDLREKNGLPENPTKIFIDANNTEQKMIARRKEIDPHDRDMIAEEIRHNGESEYKSPYMERILTTFHPRKEEIAKCENSLNPQHAIQSYAERLASSRKINVTPDGLDNWKPSLTSHPEYLAEAFPDGIPNYNEKLTDRMSRQSLAMNNTPDIRKKVEHTLEKHGYTLFRKENGDRFYSNGKDIIAFCMKPVPKRKSPARIQTKARQI